MRIVARSAAYPAIIRVTLAMKDPVWLEPNIVNFHLFEQSKFVAASMTRAAEVLRQLIAIQPARVENKFCCWLSRLGRSGVSPSRTVTQFTTDSRDYFVEMNPASDNTASRMTTETIGDLIVGELSTHRFFYRRRSTRWCADRKVQTLNFVVVAHSAFIERTLVLEN